MASGASVIIYIRWTETARGDVTGAAQIASLPDDGIEVTSGQRIVTGTRTGDLYTLGVDGVVWSAQRISDELRITAPSPSGELREFIARPATADDFNAALGALEVDAQARAHAVSEAAAAQNELDDFNLMLQRLRSRVEYLNEAVFDVEYADLDRAVGELRTAVAKVNRSAECYELSVQVSDAEYFADTVTYYADTLGGYTFDRINTGAVDVNGSILNLSVSVHVDEAVADIDVAEQAMRAADVKLAEITQRTGAARSVSQDLLAGVIAADDNC